MYTVPDQSGRRIVVTGANSGTGLEAAKRLAGAGADVILAVRTPAKGDQARSEILALHPDATVEVRRLDLAEQASVHEFAEGIVADGRPLHALVNNAGVMAVRKRLETTDGFELQLGTNFLGPFALTNLLLPVLLQADRARVATMSSGTANFGRIRFDDLHGRRRYNAWLTYAQSKLADLLMARQLAKIADERGWPLLSTAAHPGYTRTNLQTAGRNLTSSRQRPPIRRTIIPSQGVETGAEPLLFATADPAAEQGAYYGPSRFSLVGPTRREKLPRSARSDDLAARLWQSAEELTGTALP